MPLASPPPCPGHSLDTVPICLQGALELTEQGVSWDTQQLNVWVLCAHLKIKPEALGDFLWVCVIDDGNFPY